MMVWTVTVVHLEISGKAARSCVNHDIAYPIQITLVELHLHWITIDHAVNAYSMSVWQVESETQKRGDLT